MRESLETIAKRLNRGEVAAVPTETVYGLAASLRFPQAIEQIYLLKKRPANNPLIIHIASREDLPPASNLDALIEAFWPGPLTLVLPNDTISEKARAGLPTAAFRMPAHPLTRALIQLTGPLVMPSANLSGKPSATTPEHVEEDFGSDFPILDGGPVTHGVESTILCFAQKWKIIRQGAISQEAFLPVLHYLPEIELPGNKPLCPGQLYRHYAPKATLIPTCSPPSACTLVGYSDRTYDSCRIYSLGPSNHPETIAQNLYTTLRQLDQDNIHEAYIDIDLPQIGLYRTILERLYKACTKT